ncbi:MAG: hypothetical protein H6Q67_1070 [Firmicutes bacterium]|nr:hypothetical protein [Bacillota bacterium]
MKTLLFSAHTQLPEGTDLHQTYRYVSVILKVNSENGQIIDCAVPIYCQLTADFIAEIIRGKSIETDLPLIIKEMEERLFTGSRRALISALQMIRDRYMMAKK